jgi:CubicO group peptidase (beta-lactamase class C family)
MKKIILFFALIFATTSKSQSLYFPPLTGNTWETISTDELGWCQDSLTQLINYVGDNNSKALIILKGGKIALEHYYGTFVQDSLWYWASAGKTMTSFLVGMAKQEGLLSLDDPSNIYLGEGWSNCTPEQENAIKIRHHISMTTGLDDGVPNVDCTIDTCLNYLADPGTRWAYHNAPYTIIDEIISNAAGVTLNNFFLTRVRNRTAINGIYFQTGDNNVFYSTARSMARFGLLMQNNGTWQNDVIMTDASYFNEMITPSQNLNNSYGYLWWLNGQSSFMMPGFQLIFPGYLLPDAPADMICALGKNGQYLLISPSEDLIIVRMGNDAEGINGAVPTIFANSIVKKILNANCGVTSNNEANPNSFSIFPNPGNGIITVNSGSPNGIHQINITDLSGRTLESFVDNNKLNISNYQTGIYLIHIKDNNGNSSVIKYVKSK